MADRDLAAVMFNSPDGTNEKLPLICYMQSFAMLRQDVEMIVPGEVYRGNQAWIDWLHQQRAGALRFIDSSIVQLNRVVADHGLGDTLSTTVPDPHSVGLTTGNIVVMTAGDRLRFHRGSEPVTNGGNLQLLYNQNLLADTRSQYPEYIRNAQVLQAQAARVAAAAAQGQAPQFYGGGPGASGGNGQGATGQYTVNYQAPANHGAGAGQTR